MGRKEKSSFDEKNFGEGATVKKQSEEMFQVGMFDVAKNGNF